LRFFGVKAGAVKDDGTVVAGEFATVAGEGGDCQHGDGGRGEKIRVRVSF